MVLGQKIIVSQAILLMLSTILKTRIATKMVRSMCIGTMIQDNSYCKLFLRRRLT